MRLLVVALTGGNALVQLGCGVVSGWPVYFAVAGAFAAMALFAAWLHHRARSSDL